MTDRIPHRSPLRIVGLTVLFAGVIALLVAAFCTGTVIIGYLLVEHGVVSEEELTAIPVVIGVIGIGALLITIPLSWALYITFVRPIRSMASAVERLADGDFSHRIDEDLRFSIYEMRAFAHSYNIAAEELASTELMRNSFIGDFSHEFRTPITALNGFAQLLRADDLTHQERAEYLDIIVHESERLASLSERILMLSRLETASILPNVEPVRIDEQIRRCVLMLQSKWESKGVEITVDLDACTVRGDKGYLAEVWINLLDNAVKFSPEGGTVSVSLYGGRGPEDLRDPKRNEAVVWVSDGGAGIDAKARRHLFEKFYQADDSHTSEGNGLGLALCKRIVELHGGSIGVESRAGSGTVFEVRLPLG